MDFERGWILIVYHISILTKLTLKALLVASISIVRLLFGTAVVLIIKVHMILLLLVVIIVVTAAWNNICKKIV